MPFWYFCVLRKTLERENINECITKSSVEKFKELISTVDWNLITQTLNPHCSYFSIDKFFKIYDEAFPLKMEMKNMKNKKMKNKNENEQSRQPLGYNMDQKIIKQEKKHLYEKFLKPKLRK